MDDSPNPAPKPGRSAAAVWLSRGAERLASVSWQNAPRVLLGTLMLTILFGWFAAWHLGIDTQTNRLLDPSLPWRQRDIAYNVAFPQGKRTLAVVIESESLARGADAATRLADALAKRTDMFQSVLFLEGLPFLQKNGLLLQDLPKVKHLCDQMIASSALLGPFAADPSMRGLFNALNQALTGVNANAIPPGVLDKPFAAMASTIEAQQAGKPAYLSWSDFMGGKPPALRETLHVIALKPVLNHTSLSPGKKARQAVLETAASLGLNEASGVHLSFSGDVALEDEELASVKDGMGLATALSFALVLVILFAAIRSPKPVLAIVVTLLTGLVWSLAFAAASVHVLNLISVAFVVMFIGIAVDFGIQFCVRYRDEQTRQADTLGAIARTGATIGGALSLAAITTAIGFLAFAPTAYRGVSELGIIAGAAMLIALFLNLTLLPALLRYLNPKPAAEPPALFKSERPDRWIQRNHRFILAGATLILIASLALLPKLSFDFNPLNLKDPHSESVRTLNRLVEAGLASPSAMQLLVADRATIGPLSEKLKALPDVGAVLSIETFIPKDQDKKLAVIQDAAFLLTPALAMSDGVAPPSMEETRESIQDTADRLKVIMGAPPSYARLAGDLERLLRASDAQLAALEDPLTGGLKDRIARLRLVLQAEPVTFESLPEPLTRQWIAPDGRFRLEIRPKEASPDNAGLRRFVAEVLSVAPDAVGGAFTIEKSGDAVWTSFQQAFLYALIGIVAVLAFTLGRLIDVLLIAGPLAAAALITLALTVLLGLPLNFANVIALPLLMGIGVAFYIYFVTNWRLGVTAPLRSSTARAVVFSAATVLTAVMSLAVSPHRGTASMGQLLTLCLSVTLVCALVLLPALLAAAKPNR